MKLADIMNTDNKLQDNNNTTHYTVRKKYQIEQKQITNNKSNIDKKFYRAKRQNKQCFNNILVKPIYIYRISNN